MKTADFRRGIKAGVAAAAVYLIISVIFEVAGISVQFGDITMAAGLRTSLELMDPSFVITLILVDIVPRVIRGIVFGAVFAALYNYLPGLASYVKGAMLSLFLWILAVIQVIYTTPGWPWHTNGFSGSGTYYSGMISLSSVGLALAGIISALAFGALAGFLWDRFRGRELAEGRNGGPLLLISFIFAVLMWALSATGFIIGVVIRGAPLIEPGPSWWYGVLFTFVVFVGLPAWLLVLVAWRKTRGGESGLKPGVAGGIIMALTGQMLLPGVLAIIGGLFSRRKPTMELSTVETEQ